MRGRRIVAIVLASLLISQQHAEAGLGVLLRKGLTALTKGSAKTTRKTAGKASRTTIKGAVKTGQRTGKQLTVATASRAGAVALPGARVVVNDLGVEGAQVLGRLSPTATGQLAAVSGELAKSPYRRQWLATLKTHGDAAARWLWKRKGSIVVATGATAVALKPEEFLRTVKSVAETATREVSEHVAAPIAKEMAAQAAATVPWSKLWAATRVCLAAVCCYALWRWWRR